MHNNDHQISNLQRGMTQRVVRLISAPNRIRFDRWIFTLVLVMASGSACSEQKEKVFSVTHLVGIKIPARAAGSTGYLPGWNEKGGWSLGDSKLRLGLSEYYRGNQAIFIITRADRQLNGTILDARKLPMHVIDYRIADNNIVFLKDAKRYGLAANCESKVVPDSIIVALAKPEKRFEDCAHKTGHIYAAWAVDARTGKLRSIDPKGVTCLLDDFEDSCEHMQTMERD
ncbi:MAG: hypothetical protein ABL877_05570 [Thiobacillus sp.]